MHPTAVLLHLSHTHSFGEFSAALSKLNTNFDLYVNLVEELNSPAQIDQQSSLILSHYPTATVVQSANRGMDIGGMFKLFGLAQGKGYTRLMYAHSKSDTEWRQVMLAALCGVSDQVLDELASHNAPLGMIGTYAYPFDYYNLSPYLELVSQLEIPLTTDWQEVIKRRPVAGQMDILNRVDWAKDQNITTGRPELDIEYAKAILGDFYSAEQKMNKTHARRFISDGVIGPLAYFPGNFFWLSGKALDFLASKIDFSEEIKKLPADLQSDSQTQSRAHAWERVLPSLFAKNGFAVRALRKQQSS